MVRRVVDATARRQAEALAACEKTVLAAPAKLEELEAYRAVQNELLSRLQATPATGDATRRALTGFFKAIQSEPGVARVFLIDLDDHGGAMRMASFEGANKLSKAFGLKATHPLMIAGIVGGIVDIGKRWIESDFAEPLEQVVDIALPFTRLK